MSETIGVIGLGRMGMAAARRYMRQGHAVVGYDVRPEPMNDLKILGGTPGENPKEVASKTATVIVYVLNDQQVIEVVTGPRGILEGCHHQTKVVCMSTIDRENVEWVADQCARNHVGFVDCPVTGGQARLEGGTVTLIAAAPKDVLEGVRPVLEVQGQIVHAGAKPGLGQAVKHCNQLLVGATLAATAELVTLARKSGLDPRVVCQVVGEGICGSDYFRLLAASILENTPSPGGLGQMCKDVGLIMNDARRAQVPLVVASAAYQYFLAALSLGMESADSSDLIKVLERMTSPDA